MARPQDKDSLLQQADLNYTKLMELINNLPVSVQEGTFPFEDRDKNIRDVLIHLYEWHLLILNWINKNDKENIPTPFIPSPYN